MICKNCGKPFLKGKERLKFNNYFKDSSMWDFDEDTPGDLCFDCADEYCSEEWMLGELSAADGPPPEDLQLKWLPLKGMIDLDAFLDDEDSQEMPECCSACGNTAYPECQSSCPLFDD